MTSMSTPPIYREPEEAPSRAGASRAPQGYWVSYYRDRRSIPTRAVGAGRSCGGWSTGQREPHGIRLSLTLFRDYLDSGPRRALQLLRHSLDDRIEEKLPHINAPTVVVRGSRDPIVSQKWAQAAADALPRGRLAVIPGAAHAINFGAPLELSRFVRSLARHIECPTST